MSPLFKKLNYQPPTTLFVLDAPESFEPELALMNDYGIRREITKRDAVSFGLAFAVTQSALDRRSTALVNASVGDATLWIAYPKGSSKRYRCEFNRDSGWDVLADAGFEPVRMVAIDEDWSALRFRRVEFIKAMTRSPTRANTSVGKSRTTGN